MHNRLRMQLGAGALGLAVVVTGCTSDSDDNNDSQPSTSSTYTETQTPSDETTTSGTTLEHPTDGGPAPQGIAEANDPTYPVGTQVTLTADHMEGMEGATATISGAYDTFTYSVNYIPADGGDPVTDHKWVVHEEIEDAGEQRLADGTEVTLLADHMAGMKGVTATIASSTTETVYMVDYESDGETMTNHKWVVESEIEPLS